MSRVHALMRPLAFVLVLPLGVAALGVGARSRLDARWTESLARQLTVQRVRPDARTLARYSLASLCADGLSAQRIPPCRTYNVHSALVEAAAVVAAAGVAFLGALMLAGFACRSRRRAPRCFRPTALFIALGTTALAGTNGLLATAGSTAGWAFITGRPVERVSVSFIFVAGAAAVAWVVGVSSVAFTIVRPSTLTLVGRRIAMSAHPALGREVVRAAAAVGADPPLNVVACLAPWMAVTEMGVTTLDGPVSGRTLCLSLPLCRILSTREVGALLVHELFHFSREEAEQGRLAHQVKDMALAVRRIAGQSRGIRRLAAGPPLALFGFLLQAVDGGGAPAIDREIRADRAAAAVAGRDVLASALTKVHVFGPAWIAVIEAMVSAVHSGTQYVNASALFQEVAESGADPDRMESVGRWSAPHPTDRHPPLADRLEALAIDRARLESAALAVTPEAPALGLLADAEAIELDLSSAEHRLLARTS